MPLHQELKTIIDYIRYAASAFEEAQLCFGHGTDNAWDEAIALILPSLYLSLDSKPAILQAALLKKEKQKLHKLIEKRIKKRIPVAYLTNEAYFANLKFYVDDRVLIPRSPLSELIQDRFEPWIDANSVEKILDLCTGSGCIAIACASAFPDATVDATDISVGALAVAKKNVFKHNMQNSITLIKADLFKGIQEKKYDIIVSNPPYVSTQEMKSLPKEYLHEPSVGLAAGKTGLDFVDIILRHANNYLADNGILVVEVGNSESTLIEKYQHAPFVWLEFTQSDGGVFLLTAEQLKNLHR